MILYVGSYTQMISKDFGGYGEGIYCFDFNERNGSIQLIHITPAINPSYLCIPSKKNLYSHTEVLANERPLVQAYKINQDNYSLELINEQEIPGGCPCYLTFFRRFNSLFVACYETGNIVIYPIDKNAEIIKSIKVLQHEGGSINNLRQACAHSHAVLIDEELNNVFIADLGMDKVLLYHISIINGNLNAELKQEVSLLPGSGPRHTVYHKHSGHVFALNELTGTITVMRYLNGCLEMLNTYSSLPEKFEKTPGSAAIRVSTDGKFVYTSERSDDSISILKFESCTGKLELIGRQKTLGKTPRDFVLDPTGNWLLAANQDSDSIAVFKIDKNTGLIEPVHLFNNIKSPACLEWLPA